MFEEEAKKYGHEHCCDSCKNLQTRYIKVFKDGAEFGYNKAKDKLDEAKEIIEQMKDLFFDCWQEKGYEAIKFEQKVDDFLKGA